MMQKHQWMAPIALLLFPVSFENYPSARPPRCKAPENGNVRIGDGHSGSQMSKSRTVKARAFHKGGDPE